MREWREIIEEIAHERGVSVEEADAIYRRRIAEVQHKADTDPARPMNRAQRRAAARRA